MPDRNQWTTLALVGLAALLGTLQLLGVGPEDGASDDATPPVAETIRADVPPAGPAPAPPDEASGDFTFYVLSLSWSPTYCGSPEGARDHMQCKAGRPFAFVVHGLWPQRTSDWPEFCPSSEPERVDNATIDTMLDIMPSPGLIGHQWRKHGTCTGLDQPGYFALVRRAYDSIAIPPPFHVVTDHLTLSPAEIRRAFVDANPGMSNAMLTVTCSDRQLDEVRICLSRDLSPVTCSASVTRAACRRDRVTLPPVR